MLYMNKFISSLIAVHFVLFMCDVVSSCWNRQVSVSILMKFIEISGREVYGVATFGGNATIGGSDFLWQCYYRNERLMVAKQRKVLKYAPIRSVYYKIRYFHFFENSITFLAFLTNYKTVVLISEILFYLSQETA